MITISVHVREDAKAGDILLSMEASDKAGEQPPVERHVAEAVLRFLQSGINAGAVVCQPAATLGFEDKHSACAQEMKRKMMGES